MGVLFSRGYRLFTVTWLLFALGGLGHLSAQVPESAAIASTVEAMKATPMMENGAIDLSLYELFVAAWIEIGLLILGLALVNLTVVARSSDRHTAKRALSIASLTFLLPLVVVFVVYPVPPALIVFGVTSVLLAVDVIWTLRSASAA